MGHGLGAQQDLSGMGCDGGHWAWRVLDKKMVLLLRLGLRQWQQHVSIVHYQ